MKDTLSAQQFSPGVMSMLPLFYIGWSDSVLSPSEIDMMHDQLRKMDFLSEEDKDYLISYTDPRNPPSETVFKNWLEAIKFHSKDLPLSDKQSLAQLGWTMARKAVAENDTVWEDRATKDGLKKIQSSLGLENDASLKLLLGNTDRKALKEHVSTPSFDPKKLQKVLDGNKEETITRVKKLLRDPFFEYHYNTNKEEKRQDILKKIKALADQGLGAYAYPMNYGGPNEQGNHIAVFETLAYGDISLLVKFGVQFGLFGGSVFMLGTERHHRQYIQPMTEAKLLGCFAMTETGHGSNVRGLETTATYDPSDDTIIINTPNEKAGKEYIGNALHCSMATVFAQLIVDGENHGVHAVLVPIRNPEGNLMPGIRVEDCGYKIGLNGVDNGRLWFDQVKVPRVNLLNKYGNITEDGVYESAIENPNKRFFTMLGALVAGRISVGLGGINATKLALAIAVKYACKRRQFEGTDDGEEILIMDYPTHQRRLIPRIAKTYGYYFALRQLTDEYNESTDENRRIIETKAAGLKSMATWHAMDSITEAREACGGKGYLSENRIGQIMKDVEIFTTFEGDNTVLMQLVSKGLLTQFNKEFHDEGFYAVMRYLRDRISNTIVEFNPIYRKNDSISHLMDRDFHLDAFKYREKKLLLNVSSRMQSFLKKRLSPHDAFMKTQNHLLELAKAYVEHMVLRRFVKKIDTMEEGAEKVALNTMCDMYALSVIEENKGWYLENSYMDGNKTRAIRRLVDKLCLNIRKDIIPYVDAWGIPEDLLDAAFLQGQ